MSQSVVRQRSEAPPDPLRDELMSALSCEALRDFNEAWFQSWTDKDIARIPVMHSEDCSYMGGTVPLC